jgi:toxin ParE1/3/4
MTAERALHKADGAVADLRRLVDYYRKEAQHAVTMRFIDKAEQAFDQLVAMPRIGAIVGLDELPYEDIRRWHIDGFPYIIIYYREVADGIEVIRILHSSRDIPQLFRNALA